MVRHIPTILYALFLLSISPDIPICNISFNIFNAFISQLPWQLAPQIYSSSSSFSSSHPITFYFTTHITYKHSACLYNFILYLTNHHNNISFQSIQHSLQFNLHYFLPIRVRIIMLMITNNKNRQKMRGRTQSSKACHHQITQKNDKQRVNKSGRENWLPLTLLVEFVTCTYWICFNPVASTLFSPLKNNYNLTRKHKISFECSRNEIGRLNCPCCHYYIMSISFYPEDKKRFKYRSSFKIW